MTVTLTFDDDEVDLLLMALQEAICSGDDDMMESALALEGRLINGLPPPGPAVPESAKRLEPSAIRALIDQAIQGETLLQLAYTDAQGRDTERRIHPVLVTGELGDDHLVAWCERRRDFRQFRLERIRWLRSTGLTGAKRRRLLLAEWRTSPDMDGWP